MMTTRCAQMDYQKRDVANWAWSAIAQPDLDGQEGQDQEQWVGQPAAP